MYFLTPVMRISCAILERSQPFAAASSTSRRSLDTPETPRSPRLLVDDVADLLRVAELLHEVDDDERVYVAAAGAHEEALRGAEAHGGVYTLAAVYRGDGASVSEVAGDYLKVFYILAKDFRGAVRDVAVARAVKAVAADAVLLIVLVGDAVNVGLGRHGLVESGVEDDDVRLAGEDVHDGFEAHEVRGVVERSEGDDFFDSLDDFGGDEDGLRELLAAVDYAVAGRAELVEALEDAEFRIDEDVENVLDSRRVVGEGNFARHGVEAGLRVLDARAFDSDALDETLRKDLLAFHVDELILQRRASAVENKNFH